MPNTYLIKLDDVGMSNYFENVDFTSYSLDIWLIFNFVFLQNLNSNFFSSNEMSSKSNFTKSSLSEWTAYEKYES